MKVIRRILIKTLILLLVIALCGAAAVYLKESKQSTALYTAEQYLRMLLEDEGEKAYSMLDQNSGISLSLSDYLSAVKEKKYSTYDTIEIKEDAVSTGADGLERARMNVAFLDSAGDKVSEESFTLCSQTQKFLGFFEQWKVLPDHCLISDYEIAAVSGAEVLLDGKALDKTLAREDTESGAVDVYRIPYILPGEHTVEIRHPVLETIESNVRTEEEKKDFSADIHWNKQTQDAFTETGSFVVKNLLLSAVQENPNYLDPVFELCMDSAKEFVAQEGEYLQRAEGELKQIDVDSFVLDPGEPVLLGDREIQAVTGFSFHYTITREVTITNWDEYNDDGTPVEYVETRSESGTSAASLEMIWKDGKWELTAFDLPITTEVTG